VTADTPFTRLVANDLEKEYIQYGEVGQSNEALFRYISKVNAENRNTIIIVLFTLLQRKELVDKDNLLYTGFHWNNYKQQQRKKQTENFYINLYNETQVSAEFWRQHLDAKMACLHRRNRLISVWDRWDGYLNSDIINTIYDNKPSITPSFFRDLSLDKDCFVDTSFADFCKNSGMLQDDGHGDEKAHKYFSKLLIEGKNVS